MKRVVILLATGLLASTGLVPAAAQSRSCTAWTFSNEDTEVGKQWTASVCSSGDKGDSTLLLTCHRGRYNMRYLPMVEGAFENQKLRFEFASEADKRTLLLTYEAMDGAFTDSLEANHPLMKLIRAGAMLTVSEKGGKVPAKKFALKGASRALTQSARRCAR